MDKIVTAFLIILSLTRVALMSPLYSENSLESLTEDRDVSNLIDDEDIQDTDIYEYPSELLEEIKSRILKSFNKTEPPKRHVPLPELQTLNFGNLSRGIETNFSKKGEIKTDFLPASIGE